MKVGISKATRRIIPLLLICVLNSLSAFAQVSWSGDTINSCGPYTWTNGITYDNSNWTATDTFTNTAGSDSIVTLNLTVVHANLLQGDTAVCKGSTLTFSTQYRKFDTTGFIDAGVYNGFNYYFDRTIRSWTAARENAVRACSDLAMFDSMPENAYVHSQITAKLPSSFQTIHFGMIQDTNASDYSEPAGGWRWLNGDTLTFTNWGPSEPSNTPGCVGSERWGTIWPSGKWNDNCSGAGGRALVKVKPADISYLWSTGETTSSISITADSSTTYKLTVTYNGASCTDSIVVTLIKTASTVDVMDCDSVISPNGKVWKTTGTFQDTLTNAVGCDSLITFNVTIDDTTRPMAATNNITAYLDDCGRVEIAALDIDNSSSDNCRIASYSILDSVFNCSDRGPNVVWLRVTDIFGNIDSASAIVTVQDTLKPSGYSCDLEIQANDTSFCVDYSDSIDLATTSGFDAYRWYEAANPATTLSTDTFLKVKPSKTVTYVVEASGDVARKTILINVLPIFSLGPDNTLCAYDSMELSSGLSGSLVSTYNWVGNISASNDVYEAKYPTNLVWLEVIDTNDCIWRDSIGLTWQKSPELELSADTLICPGEQASLRVQRVTLDGSEVNKNFVGYSYTWTASATLQNTVGVNNTADPIIETYYYATISDGLCTGNTDSILVFIKPKPITQITPKTQTLCGGVTASYTASGGTTYMWYNIGGFVEPESSDFQKSFMVISDNYIAVQAIESECKGDWDTAWIILDTNSIIADFTLDPIVGYTTFEPTVTNTSTGGDNYLWNFGNGSTLDINNLDDITGLRMYFPEYPIAGEYNISLLVTRANECRDSITKTIVVSKKFILEIPTAFSPNGDGLNERFNITTSPGVTVEGTIYNRWGEKMYEWTTLPDATPSEVNTWDGTYQREPVPLGTYQYVLKLREPDNTVTWQSGSVLIIR
jgi:gliding motility-associated-like protein|tara:strand:+ start:219 stop:3038 length:2820 start_codon:yes stop_codon:yes gene_type:complete